MTTPLKLDTQDIQFGSKYDPRDLNRMQQQLNAVTRFTQKLLQMLRAGQPGQVLTKTETDDLIAQWADSTGGSSGPTWRVGHGLPDDSVGNTGDLYLDLDTGNIYELEA